MIVGTADPRALAARAPRLESFPTDPLDLGRVEMLQLACEIAAGGAEALYPPALHPTLPPLAVWQISRCSDGELGSFTMALLRLSCRSGVRPRGFVVAGFADSLPAARALASRFGYPLRPAELRLRRFYDEAAASVRLDGRTILELSARDAVPLSPGDVQYTAAMHLAETPKGLRLLQVEPEYRLDRAERGKPRVIGFDAAAWGGDHMRPTFAVSAAIVVGTVTVPPIRYVCRPDVLSLEGTERV
jgi:Acetoacetate decarboxylase (ADC)